MRDAARKLLSVSWRRAPNGGETHSSPPEAAASRSPITARTTLRVDRCRHTRRHRCRLRRRRLRRHRPARPARPRHDPECLDDGSRPPRPAAARLHDAGRALASTRRSRGRRPALPRDAHGVRGQTLLRPRRRRHALAGAGGRPARREPPHRFRRLDAHHAGRASHRRPLRALRQRQDRARSSARCGSSITSTSGKSCRCTCAWRRSAATSRACARRRSPTSARSRDGCRWARRRCSSRCRSRPSGGAPTATRGRRASRAIACCSGRPRKASLRQRRRNARPMSPYRSAAVHSPSWRRISPKPKWPPIPRSPFIG